MSLRLYDTATAAVRDFVPLVEGRVGLYLCGATVQSDPHIGHLRSAVAFDQLWRWLEAGHGYDVTFVRNVTDVDDKILAKSRDAGVAWWAWALQHERAFTAAYDAVGLRRPTYEPRATGHVTEMVALIDRLVERGHAYRAEDGSSDVYFDVRSWERYGSLTHQRLDDMAPAEDADPRGKRDPRDFALWKSVKPDEPETASWPTPYGVGRPGWHLECSAMIRRYLGEEFDVHGGGIDLRFPHHENEQAQSQAAGYGFARYWLHNGWVTTGGEKMSKSLGNSLLVTSILERVRPLNLRYYLGSAHYRSNIEFHEGSLAEAATAMARIEGFLTRASQWMAGDTGAIAYPAGRPKAFDDAMDDDLNVSAALAVVHDTVREGNAALDARDADAVAAAFGAVSSMTSVLGINPHEEPWVSGNRADERWVKALDALVRVQIDERAQARSSKDWASADAVRDRLAAAGVVLVDGPDGTSWRLSDTEDGS
ncbi:cysteine--tRNA ligase [Angustibacter speluncae]